MRHQVYNNSMKKKNSKEDHKKANEQAELLVQMLESPDGPQRLGDDAYQEALNTKQLGL